MYLITRIKEGFNDFINNNGIVPTHLTISNKFKNEIKKDVESILGMLGCKDDNDLGKLFECKVIVSDRIEDFAFFNEGREMEKLRMTEDLYKTFVKETFNESKNN